VLTDDGVTPKIEGTWSYSYLSGEGTLEIKEAGKTYYGLSYLVINGHKLSLSQPVEAEELQRAGFVFSNGQPITLAKGFYLFSVDVEKRFAPNLKG
jgi:hypothetical protein